ncbi:hypothetical protein OF83DRAFT_1180276 [Amylostereum chailletii]|nr:hypothetical protein OF83DRAFT_1180276 [Amylostereum chailletii]
MPSLIPLDNILGVAYIGIMLSTVVYGITCLQVYLYYTEHSENDGRFLKTFVAVLMAMDTIHVALSSSSYYHYTVTNFGDYIVLAKTTWSLGAQGTVGIFLSLLVQWFFAYRIYLLSGRRRIIPALICLISLAHMVLGGVVYVINALELVFFASSSSNLPYGISTLALDMSCDFIIAVTMVYYLRRGHTNISVRTNGAIRLLVIYTMNTCVLTTMCAAASLVSQYPDLLPLLLRTGSIVLVFAHDDPQQPRHCAPKALWRRRYNDLYS